MSLLPRDFLADFVTTAPCFFDLCIVRYLRGLDFMIVRYAARVKLITNDAAKASESKEIQRLKARDGISSATSIGHGVLLV